MSRFRFEYGAGPLHLLGVLAALAIAGYGFLTYADDRSPVRFLIWFAGAAIVHDLLLFPLYAAVGRALARITGVREQPVSRAAEAGRVRALNHLRIPAMLSALLLLLFFPLILELSEPALRAAAARDTDDYLARWLLLTAALFAGSAVLYAVRLAREARTARV